MSDLRNVEASLELIAQTMTEISRSLEIITETLRGDYPNERFIQTLQRLVDELVDANSKR